LSPNSKSTLVTAVASSPAEDHASPASMAEDKSILVSAVPSGSAGTAEGDTSPADTAGDKASPASLTACFCSSGPKSICPLHRCLCAECRKGKNKRKCQWRNRHLEWMKDRGISSNKLMDSPYFYGNDQVPRDHLCGVDSNRLPARESSLIELLWHNNSKSNLLVADISQSLALGGVRHDGVVPTIACSGKMWVFLWGRVLTANELATLM